MVHHSSQDICIIPMNPDAIELENHLFPLCCVMCISTYCSDSDSDSELSVDEHSSSYASSHSSDSEEEKKRSKPKWNNERSPVHSTPKGTTFLQS